MTVLKKYDRFLLPILLIGLLLRVLYVYVFFDLLFPIQNNHFTGDSFSYIDSVINLIQNSTYCFDLKNPDSYFGRLPGYPFFVGIHYLILGEEYFIEGVIFSQVIIDTICIYLVYKIIQKITSDQRSALIGSFIYATFPFVVTWPATISTECISCFTTLLWLYYLTNKSESRYYVLGLGLICALCFFMRSYLGILSPITVIYLWFSHAPSRKKIKPLVMFTVGFMIIYMWWPIRNYVFHDRLILIKPSTAGYTNFTSDVFEYTAFYHCFSNDDNEWVEVLASEKTDVFPDFMFESPADKKLANDLLVMARQCGSGFKTLRGTHTYPYEENCNDTIAKGFHYLTQKYMKNNLFDYHTRVPLQNIEKAFFKHKVENKIELGSFYLTLFFMYRSVLVIIGFIAMVILWRNKFVLAMSMYTFFIYIYICFYFRSLEMRYLIQGDVLLLICVALLIDKYIVNKKKSSLTHTVS